MKCEIKINDIETDIKELGTDEVIIIEHVISAKTLGIKCTKYRRNNVTFLGAKTWQSKSK